MKLSKKIIACILSASFVLGSNISIAAVNASVINDITINPESKKTMEVKKKSEVLSEGLNIINTGINIDVYAIRRYSPNLNWDGVSNVAQFVDSSGTYCFAYDKEKYVFIVKMENGIVTRDSVRLKKVHNKFGGVTCDNLGNYYLVTGETNTGNNINKNTIFISKYDKNGNLIKTTGDNGMAYDGNVIKLISN